MKGKTLTNVMCTMQISIFKLQTQTILTSKNSMTVQLSTAYSKLQKSQNIGDTWVWSKVFVISMLTSCIPMHQVKGTSYNATK